jgi:hypothetical protein
MATARRKKSAKTRSTRVGSSKRRALRNSRGQFASREQPPPQPGPVTDEGRRDLRPYGRDDELRRYERERELIEGRSAAEDERRYLRDEQR